VTQSSPDEDKSETGIVEQRLLLKRLHWQAALSCVVMVAVPLFFSQIPGIPIGALIFFPLALGCFGIGAIMRSWRIETKRLRLWMDEELPVLFHTALPPDACRERLESATDIHRNGFSGFWQNLPLAPFVRRKAMQVRFNEAGFVLKQRQQNQGIPVHFFGRLQETKSGTEIKGFIDFDHDPLDRAFPFLWFGLVALMALIAIFTALVKFAGKDSSGALNDLSALVFIFVMGLFGFGIAKAKQLATRKSLNNMVKWIEQTLEARCVAPSVRDIQPPLF
jgi:hypothetical protein